MVNELHGLGLDIKILDVNGEEINLTEDTDEDDSTPFKSGFENDYHSDESSLNSAGFEIEGGDSDFGMVANDDNESYGNDDDDDFDDDLEDDDDFDDGLEDEDDDFDESDDDSDDFDDEDDR